MKQRIILLAVSVVSFLVSFAAVYYFVRAELQLAERIQVILMAGLVGVTIFYARATHKQAEASAETAVRMQEQTVMASRPVIIQKAVYKTQGELEVSDDNPFTDTKYFSHFEILNVGNGPAIELEVCLLDGDKSWVYSQRETFLQQADTMRFMDANALFSHRDAECYVVCEFQLPFAVEGNKTWQQTWLPIKVNESNRSGEIWVVSGELEFKEVGKMERIPCVWNKPY